MDRRNFLWRAFGAGMTGLVGVVPSAAVPESPRRKALRVDMREDDDKDAYKYHVLLNGIHRCCPYGDVFLADEAEGLIGYYLKNGDGAFYMDNAIGEAAIGFHRGKVTLIPPSS